MALEAPAAETFYRAPWWVKPRIDPEVQATVRQLLHVEDEADLPQDFLHYMAFFSAQDPDFNDKVAGLAGRWMLLMVVNQYEAAIRAFKERSWIKPGSKITVKSQNREAWYVSGAHGSTDLVSFGPASFAIVKSSDIEADPLSIKDSEENSLIEQGKLRRATVSNATKVPESRKQAIAEMLPKV